MAFRWVFGLFMINGDSFMRLLMKLNGMRFGFNGFIFSNCSLVGSGRMTRK